MNLASFWSVVVYMNTLFILYLTLGAFHVASAVHRHHGNETDRLALLAFKAKISGDPFGVLSSWNDSIHFCQWYGVKCGRRHQRVTTLNLESLKLSGSISRYVGNLSFLRDLYLNNNAFIQEIPPELGRLRRLQLLHLYNNSLRGEIPANLSVCSNLFNLALDNNHLVGKIPVELGSLSKLQYLYLNKNNLSGEIPISFGNLSSLVTLELSHNALSGSIPKVLGQLTELENFDLGFNFFSGTIPFAIFNLTHTNTFGVEYNQIQGNLPLDMGITLPSLQFFNIAENQFTGSIPASLSNASQLSYIYLSRNKLTGQVPTFENLYKLSELGLSTNHLGSGEANDLSFISSLTNATDLEKLALNSNNFGGMLPESFSNLSTKLTTLYLSNNRISGSIPNGIGNFVNLEDIGMTNNQFIGNIPHDLGRLRKVQVLTLSSNKLSGNVPSSLGNLSLLITLYLQRNDFHGSISSSLGKCKNLQEMDLSENNFNGTIPWQIFHLSSLSIGLDLSHNQLTGSLPMEIGNMKNLGFLDISENILSGEIHASLGSCVSLEYLYMQGNFFRGAIPESFSSLRGLIELDLSRNNLSGQIPEYFEGFDLKYLNLSFNNLEGLVPERGIFKNASATFVNGNVKLCGGVPQLQLPTCNLKQRKKKSTLSLKIVVPTAFGFLGLTLGLCFLLLRFLVKKRKHTLSNYSQEYSLLRASYQSLLKATDSFSASNLIGAGSFGSVYKGILDDGRVIAVKVLNLQRHGASKSFVAECEALRNIRHRNLVKVLTSCSSVDYHGNDFKAIVSEFMVNGSLEQWLHRIPREDAGDAEPRHLNVLQRLNIAIDIASALHYLHNHCQTAIVHCDIKPSNILLDNEMIGHLGDFGLAKLLLGDTNNSSSQQTSSISVLGSIGYTPPEYGMGSEVSRAGDVYSYAILLLEMFTAKRPTDDVFSSGLNLHNFVKMGFPERVVEISDPVLLKQGEGMERSMSTVDAHDDCRFSNVKIQECLISVYRIGVACSVESPRERTDISHVLAYLLLIRNNFLKTSGRQGTRSNA